MTAAIMLAGTGSDVGKSFIAAGLCRAYTRRGLRVRPFKPQNMSNNAAVTADGGEIGRAQALQARACGIEAHSDMNPVLLKPQTDVGAQIVVQGKVFTNARAREYQTLKAALLPKVLDSFQRLADAADIVIIEGAGSIAEVNLRAGDIANMGFAQAEQVPVVLIGDIDRGGVIASIVGSYTLLQRQERTLLRGVLINRFRGDVGLFDDGLKIIREQTGLPSFGIVPYFADAGKLPAEDAVGISARTESGPNPGIRIAVPVFSRIANFDDLDPLRAEPDVEVCFIEPGQALPGNADLIILPGSKATIADLIFLRSQGWHIDIHAHLRRGGWLLGLCGGYQMLGRRLCDPQGVEGEHKEIEGLALLNINTELKGAKTLKRQHGKELGSGAAVQGYEMHIGITTGPDLERPMLAFGDHWDGAISTDGKIMGCYLHGLFNADNFRRAFLQRLRDRETGGIAFNHLIETTLDNLAEHLEQHCRLDALLELAHEY